PWSVSLLKGGGNQPIHFRLAFGKAVTAGTILGGVGELRILKADAPFPGDPEIAAHWTLLDAPSGQNSPRVTALPPGTSTRAILCTVREARGRVDLHLLRPLAARLHNVTPAATANADAEFAPASRVTRATGGAGWVCSGKAGQKGSNPRPPILQLPPTSSVPA